MALQRPYITNKFISYEGDKIVTNLSIAIRLIDDYTGGETEGTVKVVIKKGNIKSYKNPDGYYIFTNRVDGNYTFDIESDLYFHEESAIDTLKIKTLGAIALEFQSAGLLIGKTSAQLKDVSNLQKNYFVEFCNPKGETEEKSIKEIDSTNKVIKWRKGLKKHFSAFLFTWGKVLDVEEEKERLLKFLKDELDVGWMKDVIIWKIDENTIRISEDDNLLDIILDRDKEEITIIIKNGPTYNLWTKKEGIDFKIFGSTVRAQNYIAGIILKPKPFYPFSDHATLVRGSIISNVEEIPVNEAIVKVVGYEIETESDGNGEFVLYFDEIKNENSKNKPKKDEIIIEIEKNGGHKSLETIIEEGKTKVLGKIVFP
ncbi:hypothetical protein BAC3_00455 [uncultured bacterium]|nr:hypothetical protein BAC3_00455 [uncultured bacterium]